MSFQTPTPDLMQGQQIKLTPEEEEFVQKCARASFWTRSVPAAIGGSYLWWYLQVKVRGRPNATAGSLVAGMLGAVAARLMSYSSCVWKMAEKYPNGTFATLLRERENELNIPLNQRHFIPKPAEEESSPRAFPDDHQAPGILDLDPISPEQRDLPPLDDALVKGPISNQSYDDLRRRNREQFKYPTTQPRTSTPQGAGAAAESPALPPTTSYYDPQTYMDIPASGSSFTDSPARSNPTVDKSPVGDEPKMAKRKRFNKYGDEIDE